MRTDNRPTLQITYGKGFHLKVNGWNLSVQMGISNYCANKDKEHSPEAEFRMSMGGNPPPSPDCEVAIWKDKMPMLKWDSGDSVLGWVPVSAIPEIMSILLSTSDAKEIRARVWKVIEGTGFN